MQKGFVQFVVLGVGLLFIIGAGTWYLKKDQIPPVSVPQISQQKPLPKQPEFSDYSNQDLKFTLKYTPDLKVKADSEEEFDRRGNGNYRKNFLDYVGYEPPKPLGAVTVLDKDLSYDKNPLSIWVFDNPDNLTAESWFDQYWYYPYLWGVFDKTSKGHVALDKEATISGRMAKYKIVSYQPGTPKFIYVAKEGKMYLFKVIGEGGDKILATFKFRDKNSK